ncbi:hypothetical protein [Streptomyces sp. S.PB5]|nr:hypothetical protein [Streptomyces sp. S.PB5]MDN3029524.1 hypothetical protein [Streptomyces sp. S.PB5]
MARSKDRGGRAHHLGPGSTVANLFSTHPALERRLDQLGKSSTEPGRPAP